MVCTSPTAQHLEHTMTGYAAFHLSAEHTALRTALNVRGIPADLYQDGTSGGLLCVRVNLTSDDSEYAPHVLISTEGETNQFGGVLWTGCVYGVGADETYDATLQILQRAGATFDEIAAQVAPILRLLREGAAAIDTDSSASRQHAIDTGRYLLKGEAYV